MFCIGIVSPLFVASRGHLDCFVSRQGLLKYLLTLFLRLNSCLPRLLILRPYFIVRTLYVNDNVSYKQNPFSINLNGDKLINNVTLAVTIPLLV